MTVLLILAAAWLVTLLALVVCIRIWTGQRPRLSPGLFLVPIAPAAVVALLYQFSDYVIFAYHGINFLIGLVVVVFTLSWLVLAPAAAIEWFWAWLRKRHTVRMERHRCATLTKHPMSENKQEQFIASVLLTESVSRGASALDSFSSWLLGGFGAGVGLLVVNVNSVKATLQLATIKHVVVLFLCAAVIGLLERILTSVLVAASQAATIARTMVMDRPELWRSLDFSVVFAEINRAIFPPLRWIARRSFAKAAAGDLSAASRTMVAWAQVRGLLVLIQVALLGWALCAIIRNLQV